MGVQVVKVFQRWKVGLNNIIISAERERRSCQSLEIKYEVAHIFFQWYSVFHKPLTEQMWHGGDGLIIGLDDLRGLCQL